MRLQSLSTVAPAVVDAVVILDNGQRADVQFTTDDASGIAVANPVPTDFFHSERMTAEQTRRIVAAVIAFDRCATD